MEIDTRRLDGHQCHVGEPSSMEGTENDPKKNTRLVLFHGRNSLTRRQLGINLWCRCQWRLFGWSQSHFPPLCATRFRILFDFLRIGKHDGMHLHLDRPFCVSLARKHVQHFHVQDALEALPKWHVNSAARLIVIYVYGTSSFFFFFVLT